MMNRNASGAGFVADPEKKKRLARAAIQRVAFELTGNSTEAQILAAIWWWEPYAKARRNEKLWVVKTDEDFIEQDGVTAKPRAIRTALARLRQAKLVATTRGPHPTGRAPNSRYLRLCDGVAEQLESGTQSGRKRRADSRTDPDASAALAMPQKPFRPGTNNRFHVQEDGSDTCILPASYERRENGSDQESRRQEESRPLALEIIPELLRLQNALDEGCRLRGWSAPFLNHPQRVKRLRTFWEDCQSQGLDIELACKIAKHFAENYAAGKIAAELARPSAKVSETPDHFNLSMCSNFAISQYREAEIDDRMWRDGNTGGKGVEIEAVRRQLRENWPLNET